MTCQLPIQRGSLFRAPLAVGRMRLGALLIPTFLLGACASYQPRPLPETPDLVANLDALTVEPAALDLPRLKDHPLDPTDGLDGIEIAMLAVTNNPKLKAERLRQGIARAQAFTAGLLPDPQLSVSLAHPSGGAGRIDGYDLGLGYDIGALVTREANRAANTASRRQVDLQLLWKEWQTIQKARELTVDLQVSRRKLKLLNRARARYKTYYRRNRKLLSRGDLTLNEVAAAVAALADMDRRIHRQQRKANEIGHQLQALLGLSARIRLPLTRFDAPPDQALSIRQDTWDNLLKHRPDLLALQAGYQSQEQRVRRAVLRQFPALNIGFTHGRDNDGLYANGLGITLDLPLFSAGRGRIAIERATREQLRGEYQTRLDQTRADIERLLDKQHLLRRQLRDLDRRRPDLQSLTNAARRAHRRGDLLAINLFALESALLENRLATLDLRLSLWRVQIALDTLLGRPLSEDR